MIEIKPFKAYLPKKGLAERISTRPINSYSEEEIKKLKSTYPYSFLNIILHDDESREMKLEDRFKKIKKLFKRSIEDSVFKQSKKETIYIYRQTNSENSYTGLIAGAATKDYQEGKIKKHEHTLEKREQLFTKYLSLTGFNAEPILLIYPKNKDLSTFINLKTKELPKFSFVSDDGLSHQLWELNDFDSLTQVSDSFKSMDSVYIADGHHRSASSNLLSLQDSNKESTQFVMSLFMDENEINIFDFNRVVKNEETISEETIMEKLQENFSILEKREEILTPSQKHEFAIYLNKNWVKLRLKKKFSSNSGIIEQIDSQIITDLILSPVFGIKDLKNDKRVGFIPGNNGLESLKDKVDNGDFDLAIAMYPISPKELKLVADNNLAMPPKSTYIEPKLRSGLTVYKF